RVLAPGQRHAGVQRPAGALPHAHGGGQLGQPRVRGAGGDGGRAAPLRAAGHAPAGRQGDVRSEPGGRDPCHPAGDGSGVRTTSMAAVAGILNQIRQRQAARGTGGTEASSPAADATAPPASDPAVSFVLETKHAVDRAMLEAQIRSVLPVDFDLRPLFEHTGAGAAAVDPDLSRFFRLSIPAVEFADLAGSPFELAYYLKDELDLASTEPDVETEFFLEEGMRGAPGMEAADLLGCWVDAPPPENRAWALEAMRVPAAWDYSV